MDDIYIKLFQAAQSGNDKLVGVLLQGDLEIDKEDSYGCTALVIAARCGHDEVVELLLQKNPEVDKVGLQEMTALMCAAQYGYDKIVELLLQKNPEVDKVGPKKMTALMLAAQSGNDKIVKLLLQKNPEVDKGGPQEMTALIHAARFGHDKVVELLLQKNPKIDKTDLKKYTALMYAAEGGHDKVVELLLQKKSEIDKASKWGDTALMLAARYGHYKVVELLLHKNPKIDKAHIEGWTALMHAAKRGYDKVVELLLDKSDTNLRDNNGSTALQLAISGNKHSVIKQFIIAKDFALDDYIKNHIYAILHFSTLEEEVTVLANLISAASDADREFTEYSLSLLNEQISNIKDLLNIESFEKREQLELCTTILKLKEKTQVIDITKEILEKFWSDIDYLKPKLEKVCANILALLDIKSDLAKEFENYFSEKELNQITSRLLEVIPSKKIFNFLKAVDIQKFQSQIKGIERLLQLSGISLKKIKIDTEIQNKDEQKDLYVLMKEAQKIIHKLEQGGGKEEAEEARVFVSIAKDYNEHIGTNQNEIEPYDVLGKICEAVVGNKDMEI